MPTRALLFDLDGTLVDFVGADTRALASTADRLGVTDVDAFGARAVIEILAFHDRWARGEVGGGAVWHERLARTAAAFGVDLPVGLVEDFLAELVVQTRAPVGVPAALARWRQGWRIGVVTNAYEGGLPRRRLAATGLAGLVDVLVVAGEIGAYEPDPAPMLVAADRLGVVPGECVVVGDSDEHDGESARRAGMGYVAADVSSVVIRVDEAIAPE
jgi:FMN phosphatase YigB (HAD superfamily)